MDQILKQLGELLFGAIPTVVLLLTLYALYHVLVHVPLQKVLAERHARTEAKTAEYEQKLRDARTAIYKAQEDRRKLADQARAHAISEARNRADAKVAEARKGIQAESAIAQAGLKAEAERLADEIVTALLRAAGVGARPVLGGRS